MRLSDTLSKASFRGLSIYIRTAQGNDRQHGANKMQQPRRLRFKIGNHGWNTSAFTSYNSKDLRQYVTDSFRPLNAVHREVNLPMRKHIILLQNIRTKPSTSVRFNSNSSAAPRLNRASEQFNLTLEVIHSHKLFTRRNNGRYTLENRPLEP